MDDSSRVIDMKVFFHILTDKLRNVVHVVRLVYLLLKSAGGSLQPFAFLFIDEIDVMDSQKLFLGKTQSFGSAILIRLMKQVSSDREQRKHPPQ